MGDYASWKRRWQFTRLFVTWIARFYCYTWHETQSGYTMIPDSGVFAERTCGLNGTLCVEENPTDSYLSVQLSLEVRKLGGRETLYRLPTSLFKRRKRITSIFSVFADPRNEHVTPTSYGSGKCYRAGECNKSTLEGCSNKPMGISLIRIRVIRVRII